jgi:predicted cobalt transporter CbtA
MAPYMPVSTAIAADTFKEEKMWHWARIVVIAIGILLLILGVIRGRELLVVG